MTESEKAKAYDDALKRAKAILKVADNRQESLGYVSTIFPELVESEDEKIRRTLIRICKKALPDIFKTYGYEGDKENIIAWLEKQGEQKTDKYEGYCEGCNNVKGCVTCVDGDQWAHYKEVEQKPVDKVEQIVSKDFYSVFSKEQVEEIDKRIEESQRLYNAKLMDAIRKAKDFPMTD